jgi:hypothetical protein
MLLNVLFSDGTVDMPASGSLSTVTKIARFATLTRAKAAPVSLSIPAGQSAVFIPVNPYDRQGNVMAAYPDWRGSLLT